jgi:hypothetical protein
MSSKLCAPALAALTLAAIASPVVAESRVDTNALLSAGHVYHGEATRRPDGYGSVPRPVVARRAHGMAFEPARYPILDCVHAQFPQCSE